MREETTPVSAVSELSLHDRVAAVMNGVKPDRVPFVDRLELWYTSMQRRHRMPAEFGYMSLQEVHAAIRFGQLKFMFPIALRLRGVELITKVDGEVVDGETDPITERLPTLLDRVDTERIATTDFELRTPVGTLRVRQDLLEEAFYWGEIPYFSECPIKSSEDYKIMNWILDRVECVKLYERFHDTESEVGANGFVIPFLPRIPFQSVMIDCVGEVPFFYTLADEPKLVETLMDRLHELNLEVIRLLEDFPYPYVEFSDNLTGVMTNPQLFTKYCLPHYQEYAQALHAQGKKMGSHTDGDLKPLLRLIRESGLDVCESFSPAPLTECTFDEAWDAWRDGGPIMWGVVPSPLLEERVPEAELHSYIDHVFETAGSDPIILGVSDMVLGNNLVDRVRYIADRVEQHAI